MFFLNRLSSVHLHKIGYGFLIGMYFLTQCYCNIAYAEVKVNSSVSKRSASTSDPYARYKTFIPPDLWWEMSDHARIPVRIWRATPQKAIILALHGFNDSRDAWEDAAAYFVQAGITLYAPDQRGFGQAPLRGEWAGHRRMIDDGVEEIRLLKTQYPDTPLYVMGESMGGAVVMCLASRPKVPKIAGYILLAPAVWGHKQLGLVADVVLRMARTLAPNWQLSGKSAPVTIRASDNDESLLRLYFDPLSLHKARVKALYGLVNLMSKAAKTAPYIHSPTLVLYGDKDQLIPDRSMKNVWKQFPAWVRKDYVPGGYHLLLRDKNREIVAQDIINWVFNPDQFLPSGGDVATSAWLSVKGKEKVPFYLPGQADTIIKK